MELAIMCIQCHTCRHQQIINKISTKFFYYTFCIPDQRAKHSVLYECLHWSSDSLLSSLLCICSNI